MVSDVFDKEENRMNYIRGMLRTLTKREENVLRMYFGIDRERRLTLEEIGRDFDRKVNYVRESRTRESERLLIVLPIMNYLKVVQKIIGFHSLHILTKI